METARRYLAELADEERIASQAEVERFVRWSGADRACDQLRAHDVANYAETLTGTVTDASSRADAVKRFLAFAKKAGYTSTNLGTHVRLRKTSGQRPSHGGGAFKTEEVTPEEMEALTAELETLKGQRPGITRDLRRAMADKDFRENAPLDAAREQQGYVEGRIRDLEAKLERAVVLEGEQTVSGRVVEVGSTVHLHNLKSGTQIIYSLVRPSEVDAAQGRISAQSPVGRALLLRRAGEEVEVAAPSGTIRFRIERIET
jgi:transcription elongation factor GreA